MLTRIEIDGFKTFEDFGLDLGPLPEENREYVSMVEVEVERYLHSVDREG